MGVVGAEAGGDVCLDESGEGRVEVGGGVVGGDEEVKGGRDEREEVSTRLSRRRRRVEEEEEGSREGKDDVQASNNPFSPTDFASAVEEETARMANAQSAMSALGD